MKSLKKVFIISLVAVALVLFVGQARAATLSQSSVSLTVGQSMTVYAYNVLNSIYLSNNSNSNVATVSISGTNVNIYAVMSGTTTATICEYNNGSCNNIYITVSGGSSGTLSLSQTSLSLTVGQTSVVTAYNSYSYGTLYVSSNSNSSVATAYVSGNTISIYGNSYGSASIVVCMNNNTSYCGTIYVNVTGSSVYPPVGTNTGINLSSLTLPVGGAVTLTSSNSNGLTVSSNSNPAVAVTSYTSNTLGCTAGATYNTITGQLCYGGGYGGGYSSIPGCTATSTYSYLTGQLCYAGGGYNGYNNISNSVQILAASAGSDTITFCQSGNYSCSTIYVTVY
ncbi:hypothetical protein HY311_02830 [Candidatus Nomurabacteria bacterium]|nr:hypothetical protein [Candidatus Nomurabacteria bacterium]